MFVFIDIEIDFGKLNVKNVMFNFVLDFFVGEVICLIGWFDLMKVKGNLVNFVVKGIVGGRDVVFFIVLYLGGDGVLFVLLVIWVRGCIGDFMMDFVVLEVLRVFWLSDSGIEDEVIEFGINFDFVMQWMFFVVVLE